MIEWKVVHPAVRSVIVSRCGRFRVEREVYPGEVPEFTAWERLDERNNRWGKLTWGPDSDRVKARCAERAAELDRQAAKA